MSDDYRQNTTTTGRVAVGGTATGEIEQGNDWDWFAVELLAGQTYVIDLEGADSDGGTLDSTVLRGLYDSEGVRIAGTQTNDGGEGDDARLEFTATESGTHYVAARGHGRSTGTYTVRVTASDTDHARGGAHDLGDITDLGGPRFPTASLDGAGDRIDYFRFTLSEAKKVGLGLRQQDADADLFLEDADGNVLSSSAEGGTSNERIQQTLLAGTYYVRVEAQEAGDNDFKLRYGVSAADPDAVAVLEAQTEGETDGPPAFGRQSYTFSLAENADGSTDRVSLGEVSATDPEGGTVSYNIAAGNDAGLFAIDSATGALSYQGTGEDYESGTTSYALTVRASDGGLHADVTVTVNVTDVDDLVALGQGDTPQSVSEPGDADLPAGVATSGRVVVGESVTGDIGTWGDRDWFAVALEAGKIYQFDLEGWYTGAGTLGDPYLRGIHDADGNLIDDTSDDDGGAGRNSRVWFTAPQDATYYVSAGAYRGVGTYTLSVTEVEDDFTAGTDTEGSVAVDGSATGEIDYAGDRDWFAVTLEAGKIYRFDLEGSSTGAGTLASPYLRGIYDADGNRIAGTTNNNDFESFNSRVEFTAPQDATYYVSRRRFRLVHRHLHAVGDGGGR